MAEDPDEAARTLAARTGPGEPNAWFEELYAAAQRGEAVVPWDRGGAHPLLEWWLQERVGARIWPDEPRAVVVGAGPGHDARLLDRLGFLTTAFDISPTAVSAAAQRLRDTTVSVQQADLLTLPEAWAGGFDLVVEAMTVQAMPRHLRDRATAAVRALVAPGGVLLVIGMHLPSGGDPEDGPPWLLTRADIDAFGRDGLTPAHSEDQAGSQDDVVRYLAEFHRG